MREALLERDIHIQCVWMDLDRVNCLLALEDETFSLS